MSKENNLKIIKELFSFVSISVNSWFHILQKQKERG